MKSYPFPELFTEDNTHTAVTFSASSPLGLFINVWVGTERKWDTRCIGCIYKTRVTYVENMWEASGINERIKEHLTTLLTIYKLSGQLHVHFTKE